MLLTAIIEEDTVLVTAMNKSNSIPTVPPDPRRALIVYGMTKPAPTSAAVSPPGYVGKMGSVSIALAERPMTVPKPQGTANMANAARSYPGTVE